ncbi:hypothetical protein UZ35_13880 [Heyndrickxia coagulans]|uniref:Uncharacterized protein n=1 Tax=Heyndrickxia coagulans TaxID=1398 RepID=A0A0C5CQA8_HEYCO|nr:hypothetical protein SB48_HM08orf04444 [Heyndrickxia coagulans]KGT38489.1 hypothetical protein P421_09510 [Heyndrickxia coagulans P38]APB35725.1 hypothetical protein BIZ35_02195 [Heyndrickxia coagulans]ATW83679.1 hypothetical protein CIW84_12105 [Heyndrickxia coagulans]AVD55665.1 hypothetical protein C3766_05775 [Heyndrickxia coagulans]
MALYRKSEVKKGQQVSDGRITTDGKRQKPGVAGPGKWMAGLEGKQRPRISRPHFPPRFFVF